MVSNPSSRVQRTLRAEAWVDQSLAAHPVFLLGRHSSFSISVSVFLYPLVATNDMDLYGSRDLVRGCEGLTLVRDTDLQKMRKTEHGIQVI